MLSPEKKIIFFSLLESLWSKQLKERPQNQLEATNGLTILRFASSFIEIVFFWSLFFFFSLTAQRTPPKLQTRSSQKSWRKPELCGKPCRKPKRANTQLLDQDQLRSRAESFLNKSTKDPATRIFFLVPFVP